MVLKIIPANHHRHVLCFASLLSPPKMGTTWLSRRQRCCLPGRNRPHNQTKRFLRLRPDFVKRDRALVGGVSESPIQAVVLERVTQMAQDLGIQIIAEGVEQAEDLEWLQVRAVDYVQGFLLARPAPKPYSPA